MDNSDNEERKEWIWEGSRRWTQQDLEASWEMTRGKWLSGFKFSGLSDFDA